MGVGFRKIGVRKVEKSRKNPKKGVKKKGPKNPYYHFGGSKSVKKIPTKRNPLPKVHRKIHFLEGKIPGGKSRISGPPEKFPGRRNPGPGEIPGRRNPGVRRNPGGGNSRGGEFRGPKCPDFQISGVEIPKSRHFRFWNLQ